MGIVSSVMDMRQAKSQKKSSGKGWVIFAIVIFLLILTVSVAGARYKQLQVQQAAKRAQAAEALKEKCTNTNFMQSSDPVTDAGKLKIVQSYYGPVGTPNGFASDEYQKSYNAWVANGCD